MDDVYRQYVSTQLVTSGMFGFTENLFRSEARLDNKKYAFYVHPWMLSMIATSKFSSLYWIELQVEWEENILSALQLFVGDEEKRRSKTHINR